MKKIIGVLVGLCITVFCFGQASESKKIIELGKAYKDFMFVNDPPKDFVKNLQADVPADLKLAVNFISQTIVKDNDLLKQQYLTLPDSQSLKYIFIVCAVSENMRRENHGDNNKLVDSLIAANIPRNEMVDRYYYTLFTAVGNKNKPFDYSKVDFKLKDYKLANETESGIFFLECMSGCGSEIWGYMNIVRPPNTSKAYDLIKKYPKFNGLKYFQFTDLNFPDFIMVIDEKKGPESYKSYYIDKYYDILLSHLLCLNKEGAKEKDVNELLLGSVLKDETLYKYTKNKELLEKIFKQQKQ
jgi:hypothetical protein